MSKIHVSLGLLLALLIFCISDAGAQQSSTVEKEPKTKLEAFQAKTGAVIIKGYSDIGELSALGSVEVKAMEFIDASIGRKQKGVTIEVKESGRLQNTDRSFIDNDEVESLLKGIDYISKATTDITKLSQFEATYKTKGHFKVTTFSSSGKISVAVSSGYIRPATAYLSLQQLSELRGLIVQAKQTLDSLK